MTAPTSRWLQATCLLIACIALHCRAAGEWVEDGKGCKVAAQRGAANERVEWSGACRDGLADGRGQLRRFVDGTPSSTYDGDMKAGRASGQGVLTTSAGVRYEGGFLDDLYAGAGRQTDAKGRIQQGTFTAGKLEGPCVLVWERGLRYDGVCKAGSADGPGTMQFTNGDRYTGDVKFGVLHGRGRYVWARGDAYEGSFSSGVLAGNGEYQFADGGRYVGAFNGNRPSGQGRAVLADGLGYEGVFERGVPTGAGSFFKPGQAALPDSKENRALLSLGYADPQLAFVFSVQAQRPARVTAAQVCRTMGRPQLPPLNWKGDALYEAMVEVKDSHVVSVALKALKPISNPTAQTGVEGAIEQAIRQTYDCPGNHVFVQQFQFKYD